MLKRIIRKIKGTPAPVPANQNQAGSSIQRPHLVDPQARVLESQLVGDVTVGKKCQLYRVQLSGNPVMQGKVVIGRYTSINGPNTDIFSLIHPVTIGNFCSIARNTSFQEFTHDYNACTTYYIGHHFFGEKFGGDAVSKGPITVGHDVWIGTQCIILSGVSIGNGAVIASNSVVTEDVPPFAIVGGSPAKIIRYRFEPELMQALMEIQWWNWDDARIARNRELFRGTLTLQKLKSIVP